MENNNLQLIDRLIDLAADRQEAAFQIERELNRNPLRATQEINWEGEFQKGHANGSMAFPEKWLQANEQAIALCEELGIDYQHPQIKSFIVQLIFKILQSL